MAALTVISWRDIPTQVTARAGRNAAKAELPNRFMVAVDAAAMQAGFTASDAYLAEWRRSDPTPCADDLEAAVAEAIAILDRDYPPERLKALVANGGKDGAS